MSKGVEKKDQKDRVAVEAAQVPADLAANNAVPSLRLHLGQGGRF